MKKRYLKTCAALCMTIVMAAGSFASVGAAQLSTAKAAASDAETMDITLNEDEIKRQICGEIMEKYSYEDLRCVGVLYEEGDKTAKCVKVYVWSNTSEQVINELKEAYGDDVSIEDSAEWAANHDRLLTYYSKSAYPDVNFDGEVDLMDIQMMLRAVLGIEKLNMNQERRADVSSEGESTGYDVVVDLHDVQKALRMFLGLEPMNQRVTDN